MSSQEYDNRNRGVLFKNDKQGNENWPDYRGNINVDGKEFWLDAWIKESQKDGKKFMSLSVKPKLARDRGAPPTGGRNDPRPAKEADGFNDKIPF